MRATILSIILSIMSKGHNYCGLSTASDVFLIFTTQIPLLRLDYGGLGLVWQNCNISVIYQWI